MSHQLPAVLAWQAAALPLPGTDLGTFATAPVLLILPPPSASTVVAGGTAPPTLQCHRHLHSRTTCSQAAAKRFRESAHVDCTHMSKQYVETDSVISVTLPHLHLAAAQPLLSAAPARMPANRTPQLSAPFDVAGTIADVRLGRKGYVNAAANKQPVSQPYMLLLRLCVCSSASRRRGVRLGDHNQLKLLQVQLPVQLPAPAAAAGRPPPPAAPVLPAPRSAGSGPCTQPTSV